MKPSTRRVLNALLTAETRSTHELCQPDVGGVRFSARVKELRDMGLTIVATPERPGSFRYRLVSQEPDA